MTNSAEREGSFLYQEIDLSGLSDLEIARLEGAHRMQLIYSDVIRHPASSILGYTSLLEMLINKTPLDEKEVLQANGYLEKIKTATIKLGETMDQLSNVNLRSIAQSSESPYETAEQISRDLAGQK
jgi:hypothetical protein